MNSVSQESLELTPGYQRGNCGTKWETPERTRLREPGARGAVLTASALRHGVVLRPAGPLDRPDLPHGAGVGGQGAERRESESFR